MQTQLDGWKRSRFLDAGITAGQHQLFHWVTTGWVSGEETRLSHTHTPQSLVAPSSLSYSLSPYLITALMTRPGNYLILSASPTRTSHSKKIDLLVQLSSEPCQESALEKGPNTHQVIHIPTCPSPIHCFIIWSSQILKACCFLPFPSGIIYKSSSLRAKKYIDEAESFRDTEPGNACCPPTPVPPSSSL